MGVRVKQNIELLEQGLFVLSDLPERVYTGIEPDLFTAAIGKHFRHVINFYECFLSGLETGRVDYDARQRDVRVETTASVAILRLQNIKETLYGVNDDRLNDSLMVKLDGQLDDQWSVSSVGRELQALLSHTTHHFALIALILRIFGMDCPEHFGVATSTRMYSVSAS